MQACRTCGGTYEPTMPDGTEYYHACPPLAAHEIAAGLEDGSIRLSRADAARVQAARDEDVKNPVPDDQPTREQIAFAALTVERPNRRDENIQRVTVGDDRPARIKAPGAGVTEVPGDVDVTAIDGRR